VRNLMLSVEYCSSVTRNEISGTLHIMVGWLNVCGPVVCLLTSAVAEHSFCIIWHEQWHLLQT